MGRSALLFSFTESIVRAQILKKFLTPFYKHWLILKYPVDQWAIRWHLHFSKVLNSNFTSPIYVHNFTKSLEMSFEEACFLPGAPCLWYIKLLINFNNSKILPKQILKLNYLIVPTNFTRSKLCWFIPIVEERFSFMNFNTFCKFFWQFAANKVTTSLFH